MNSNLLAKAGRGLALFSCLVYLVMAASASAQSLGTNDIDKGSVSLQMNEERIISTPVTRVTVGSQSVVRATATADGQQVIITAVGPGTTDVRLFLADEPGVIWRYSFTVKRRNLTELKDEIDSLLSYMVGLSIEKAGDNLVLKGDVLEPQDRERLDKVIELYPEVIDFTVDRYKQVEEDRLRDLILTDLEEEGLTTIRVEIKNVRGEFKALLVGVAFTDQARDRAQEIASLYYDDVINLIKLQKPVIEVDAVVTSLDLDKAKQLGTNNAFAAATSVSITGYLDSNFSRSSFFDNDDDNVGEAAGAPRPDEPGRSIAPTVSIAAGGVETFINAILSSDAALFYSEQHQAVLSGQAAEFNDGGSLVFQTVLQDSVSITEIEFGLQVNVTPEQKEDGKIINTIEVANKVPVGISAAAGAADVQFEEFRNSTVVEVRSEETIVLAGIDSNNLVHSDNGTPFLRRIPIVNLLFRARAKSGTESRSLVFITPTSSTVFREARPGFSAGARAKKDFIQDESIYWQRDFDWGYYNEFYEKPGNNVWYVNTYNETSYYDEPEVVTDEYGAASDIMLDDMSEDEIMIENDIIIEDPDSVEIITDENL